MTDRLYFRQLLAGVDFAVGDPVATQMVNFVYAVGDRETGDAVLIDPAYRPSELLDVLEQDAMTARAVVLTHYHADHAGGSLVGHHIAGTRELLEVRDVPVHVQSAESQWVREGSGVGVGNLVEHESGVVQVHYTGEDLLGKRRTIVGSMLFVADDGHGAPVTVSSKGLHESPARQAGAHDRDVARLIESFYRLNVANHCSALIGARTALSRRISSSCAVATGA